MNRARISLIAALLSASGLAAGAASQRDMSQVQIETQEIADGIYQNITPGYYMLFYIDAHGKPSKAQMVRVDDRAVAP